MNFYVASNGEIINVDTERVFQGSANANTLRFIGAFPSSAQVAVSYKLPLPIGATTERQLLTFKHELSGLKNANGIMFNVWEINVGVKYVDGKYVPDYTILENPGTVNVQFFITQATENGEIVKQATAQSSFVVEPGNPPEMPPQAYDDYEALLNQILAKISGDDASKVSVTGDTMTGSLKVIGTVNTESGNAERSITLSAETGEIEVYGERSTDEEEIFEFIDSASYGAKSIKRVQHAWRNGVDYGGTEFDLTIPLKNGTLATTEDLTSSANVIKLSVDPETFELKASLYYKFGEIERLLYSDSVDLPLESMVVGGEFDDETSEVILVLQNGHEIRIPVTSIVGNFLEYVKFSNVATEESTGVVSGNGKEFGYSVFPNGQIYALIVGVDTYDYLSGNVFISRGTLELNKKQIVRRALTENGQNWTEEDKEKTRSLIGAASQTDVSDIYNIFNLSGITETIEVVSTYDVRYTAEINGKQITVLPKTLTSVKKVEGNSITAKNLLDATKLQSTTEYYFTIDKNGATIKVSGFTDGNRLSSLGRFSELIPTAKIGDELYFYGHGTALYNTSGFIQIGGTSESFTFGASTPLVVTKEMLDDGEIVVTLVLSTSSKNKIDYLYVGKTPLLNDLSWQSYYSNLKNPTFNGIVSSNKNLWNDSVNKWTVARETADKIEYISNWIDIPVGVERLATSIDGVGVTMPLEGVKIGDAEYTVGSSTGSSFVNLINTIYYGEGITAVKLSVYLPKDTNVQNVKTQIEIGGNVTEYEPHVSSKLAFPETELPLGVTIDFENKKITDYGYTITFTGQETIGYYKYGNNRNSVSLGDLGDYPTQSGTPLDAPYVSTDSKRGTSNYIDINQIGFFAILAWLDILDVLGFTTAGVEPTAEEKTQAVANFKAWLTQRYESGNPVIIRYLTKDLQSERDLTEEELANLNFSEEGGATYTPIKDGIEYQNGNSNAISGANNTVTQTYEIYNKLGGDS